MQNHKIFFILISLSLVIFNCTKINHEFPKAEKGVLDLKNWDLEKDGMINLNGEWEFYWMQLLSPDDFKDNKIDSRYFINVPSKWYSFKIDNKRLNNYGYATYRLKIKLNKKYSSIALKLPILVTASKIWINKKLLLQTGIVGKNKKENKPDIIPKVLIFNSDRDELEIIIQLSNFRDYFWCGIFRQISFGTVDDILKQKDRSLSYDIFLFGVFFIFTIYHFGLFFFRKKESSSLDFAIICFLIALNTIFNGEVIIRNFFPNINWELQNKINLLTLYISFTLFIGFIQKQYPDEISKRLIQISQIFLSIISLIVLFTISVIYDQTIHIFELLLIIINSYIIYSVIKAILNKRQGALLTLIGYILIFIAMLLDIINTNTIIINTTYFISTNYFAPLGLFVFILFQSIILSQKFSRAFSRIENYSYELEKKVKERTKQLEIANNDKTDFFVNIAHETKTPLTLINNYLDMYIKKYGITKELTIIRNNFEKLLKNMIYYLDSEKIERGKILYNYNQIVDFSNILKDQIVLFSELAKNKKIEIENYIEKNIFIKIDPDAIERIINNLLDNAIRHTKSKGKIYLSLNSNNNEVKFIVKDTGIGLTDEQKNNIFEPYYQISDGEKNLPGIGMGLNIVKKIIDSVNATIHVKNRLNEGTEFTILFKKHDLSEKEKVIKKIKSDNNQDISINLGKEIYNEDRYNVLIVEDNIEMLLYLKESLNNKYNIFCAIDGKKALDKIRIIPKPNIIISDIMMENMDGYQFFEELNKNDDYKNIPFIFLTAKTSKDEKIKGLTKGAIDFISKPFVIDELIAKIDSIIRIQEALKEDVLLKLSDKYYDILEKLETVKKEVSNNLPNYKDSLYKLYHQYRISKREIEIISLLKLGLEHKEIADKLNISINTVRTYISRIYEKCKVNNKVDLLRHF